MRSLDRKAMKKIDIEQARQETGYMEGTPSERLAAVWDITRSTWAFVPDQDAERRLQRHLAVLTHREG